MRIPLLVTLALASLACGGVEPPPPAPVVVNLDAPPVATSAPQAAPPVAEKAAEAALPPEAAEYGMIGLLRSGAGGDPSAPTAPWGRDDSLGDDPLAERGKVLGTPTSGHRAATPPRIRMGTVSVIGRLPPEVVLRIVRQNFGRFRLCYEDGLRKDPKLTGKITIKLTIRKDGAVSTVGDGGGTKMPDAGVIACVTRAFSGLSFPEPDGGGTVTVVYPITFSPAEELPVPVKPPGTPATPAPTPKP